jgi:hypothetical protein
MKFADVKILTVEEAFLIEGRGVLVLPLIEGYSGPMSFSVILRKPDGHELSARALLDIPRRTPPARQYSFACTVSGIDKHDVPAGTEIWMCR